MLCIMGLLPGSATLDVIAMWMQKNLMSSLTLPLYSWRRLYTSDVARILLWGSPFPSLHSLPLEVGPSIAVRGSGGAGVMRSYRQADSPFLAARTLVFSVYHGHVLY